MVHKTGDIILKTFHIIFNVFSKNAAIGFVVLNLTFESPYRYFVEYFEYFEHFEFLLVF